MIHTSISQKELYIPDDIDVEGYGLFHVVKVTEVVGVSHIVKVTGRGENNTTHLLYAINMIQVSRCIRFKSQGLGDFQDTSQG